MLNITGLSEATHKPDNEPATQTHPSTEPCPRSDPEVTTPSYGVSLTLDELFSGRVRISLFHRWYHM